MNLAASLLASVCVVGAAHAQPTLPAKPLNVLIIGADTLRPDHLGLYGYTRPTTPHLERLAARGAVFEKAYAQGSYTLPSFASIFTSLYPEQHGATSRTTRIKDSATTLAQIFSNHGYRTAGFTGGPFVAFPYGFDKGFDSYLSGDLPRRLDSYIPAALEWIDKDRTRPFFLFLQPQDVHPPFDLLDIPPAERGHWDQDYAGPVEKFMGSYYFYHTLTHASGEGPGGYGPKPSAELEKTMSQILRDPRALRHMASVYDDRVAHFDRSLDEFWKALASRGLLENTLVVLISDHGTLFGEDGQFAHGSHLSTLDAIFRAVLVIWTPGGAPARLRRPVELIDVAPTILDLVGLRSPDEFEGRSLVALMNGGSRAGAGLVFGTASTVDYSAASRRFVRDERWKLVKDEPGGKTRLYDLSSDPQETKDMSALSPDEARRLSLELERHIQRVMRTAPAPDSSPDMLRRLRQKGYW